MQKEKFLLHVCCATCSLHPYFLLNKDYSIIFYFYNPNIHPREEYIKRLEGIKFVAGKYNIPLIIGNYQKDKWFDICSPFKKEPEGGKRCKLCYKMRIDKTSQTAEEKNFKLFSTTLSVSPHKDANAINKIGKSAAEDKNLSFYQANFKKKDGFKKTVQISKQLNLYRQNYCGCIYSKK